MRDGVKKVAILGSTAVLPRPLRVSLRERGLARLEVAKARRADLIIIAHPKSGNTWLKAMISRMYQQRYGLPEQLVHKTDEYTRLVPEIPRFAASNGHYSYEGAVGRLFQDEPDLMRRKAVVFMPRHPCDIAVSWYLQFTKRQSAHKQELINHFIEHPVDKHTISRWDFVRNSDLGLASLCDFLNDWERRLRDHPRALTLRYEDLRADPAASLRSVVDLIGAPFGDEEIEAAVQYGAFDNLRKLESQGFFKQGGLTLRNPDDPESFKVRRAKVGGYREDFTEEQLAELDALLQERISPRLGYGPGGKVAPLA